MTIQAKTLEEVHTDAIMLHALIEGAEVIYDQIKTELSPAANSMTAVIRTLLVQSDGLARDIERLRHPGQAKAAQQ